MKRKAQITIVLEKEYRKVRNYSVPKIKQGNYEHACPDWNRKLQLEPPASARRFGGEEVIWMAAWKAYWE